MSRITKSAKGQPCQVRIPGFCCFDNERTSPGHRPGGGVARKTPDYQMAYICDQCHDIVDGRNRNHPFTDDEVYRYFCDGVFRTQEILREQGLIKIIGDGRIK